MTPVRERRSLPTNVFGAAAAAGEGAGLSAVRLALELELPTDVRLIGRVVQLVSRQIRELEFPASVCSLNVPVALSEALSNAMVCGNEADPGKRVRLRVAVDESRLTLEISDEGGGFDLDRCTHDPTTPTNMMREDGRGLFLMRNLMDAVERFTAADGSGRNVVRLTLRRSG